MKSGAFRFGQDFTYRNAKFFLRRHPFAKFISGGIPLEALSNFNLVRPDTAREKITNNSKLVKLTRQFYTELKRGIKLSRNYGKAYFQFYKINGKLVFRAFEPANYDAQYDEAGSVIQVEASALVRGVASNNRQKWTGKALEVGFELINEETDVRGEGISELEIVWDVLYAIYMLVSHSAYFVARTGAGLKRLTVSEDALDQDSDLASDLADSLEDYGSADSVLVTPKTINGVEIEFDIKTVDSKTQFMEILMIYIIQLTTITGVPQSVWMGVAKGTLDSGKINEESWYDVIRDTRAKYDPLLRWFVEAIASFNRLIVEEEYMFDFSKRDEMSEDDMVIFIQKQLTTVKQYINLGLKKEKAFELAGLTMEASFFEPQAVISDKSMGFTGQNTPKDGESDLRSDEIEADDDEK